MNHGGRGPTLEPMLPSTRSPAVMQPNPSSHMLCRGCNQPMAVGEMVISCADGLVHNRPDCCRAARARVERAATVHSRRNFYAVKRGRRTGIFLTWSDCEQVTRGESKAEYKGFDTAEAARAWLGGAASTTGGNQPISGMAGMSEEVARAVPGGAAAGSVQRRAATQAKITPARLAMVQRCIDGRCNGGHEVATQCRGGCGRSLHMLTCAQVGKGYAALGNFLCPECRVAATVSGNVITPEAIELNTKTMMFEMTQGAEATAGSYADFVHLCEEYASGLGMAVAGGRMVLPYASLMAFKNFLTWLCFDDDRALSLETTMIGAGTYMTKLGMEDFSKHPSTKAHLKTLGMSHGKVHTPKTTATPLMLKLTLAESIPQRFPSSEYLRCRWSMDAVAKGVGALRNSESTGGGDLHGVLANNTSVVTAADGTEYTELKLEHSKTGHSRYITMAGTTRRSQIPTAETLRRFWRAAGLSTVSLPQAGFMVERADFWVLRVELLGMTKDDLKRFVDWLGDARRCTAIRHEAKYSIEAALRRYKAEGISTQNKKYVNIAGGAASSGALRDALVDLTRSGLLTSEEQASIVMGPLLRSTAGAHITLMPFASSSTHGVMKELMGDAYIRANAISPDPDFDLQGLLKPDFSNHSWRRLADSQARRDMNVVEGGRAPVTKEEIDLFFGWHEMELSQDMQLHYATLSLAERIHKARITGLM